MADRSDHDRCGIGIRGVAMAIDPFVWLTLFFVSVSLVGAATGELRTTASGTSTDLEGAAASVAFVLWLALSFGYHALLEWRYGQTLGKYLVSISAVREDGSQLSVRSSSRGNRNGSATGSPGPSSFDSVGDAGPTGRGSAFPSLKR